MGWSWPFTSSAPANTPQTSNDNALPPHSSRGVALTDEQRMRIFGKPGPATVSSSPSREQQADAELEAFINSFSASEASSNAQQSANSAPSTSTPSASPTASPSYDRTLPDGTLDISPDAVYPRTMSCRQQFDQAFYCQSLGGKFNDIYRYGHIKSCSEQWGAFWFCMRTNNLPEQERGEKIREFYAARDAKKREEYGSSEDVWEIRKVAVTRAFWRDPDVEVADGEGDGGVKVRE